MSVKGYAKFLLIMAGLGGLLYGVDVGVIAAALPYIERTSTFTQDEIGWIVGMALWGSLPSSLVAGLLAEWATARDGHGFYESYLQSFDCHAPGWLDLGVSAEFKATSRFSLWVEGRNLLNQTVMRNFMIAEKGPYVTAGICLNF